MLPVSPVNNFMELSFFVLNHKHALDISVFFLHRPGWRGLVGGLFGCLLRVKIVLVTHGERLDRDGHGIVRQAGSDLGSGGKSRTKVRRRISKGDDDFEILGFLRAADALRSGNAGGADDGVIADFALPCL